MNTVKPANIATHLGRLWKKPVQKGKTLKRKPFVLILLTQWQHGRGVRGSGEALAQVLLEPVCQGLHYQQAFKCLRQFLDSQFPQPWWSEVPLPYLYSFKLLLSPSHPCFAYWKYDRQHQHISATPSGDQGDLFPLPPASPSFTYRESCDALSIWPSYEELEQNGRQSLVQSTDVWLLAGFNDCFVWFFYLPTRT